MFTFLSFFNIILNPCRTSFKLKPENTLSNITNKMGMNLFSFTFITFVANRQN